MNPIHEIRLIGYYSSENVKLNPENERMAEAAELAPLLQKSLVSLEENVRIQESFLSVLRGNTVFIFKTREGELIAYHTTTKRVRFTNVRYAKDAITPADSIYKKWFVPGEEMSIKPTPKPELKIEISDLSNASSDEWWVKNEVITGIVHHVTNFGAFVDFDDRTGLIHISNLAWDKIEHPGDVLRHGDEINAVILEVDSDQRIQLGYKQLHKKHSYLRTGDVVVGHVIQVWTNAYLIQVNDIKAVLPFSEAISKDLSESDMVIATVSNNEWNSEKYRRDISISQRSFHDEFAKLHNVGDIINLRILDTVSKNGKSYVLVKHGNLRALVPLKHLSKCYKDKISNGESINEFIPFVYIGQNETSRLVSFDMRPIERAEKELEQQRLQEEKKAEKMAFVKRRRECIESITSKLDKGTILEVVVEEITKAGIFVKITDDYSEFIAKEELSINKVLSAEDEVFVGEPISVVYLGTENGKIILSRKAISDNKYPEELYDKSLEELLLTMGINTNKFIGKVIKIGEAYFATNLMVVSEIGNPDNGKLLVDPISGLRIMVYVNNRLRNLVLEGRFYTLQLNLSFYDYRKKSGTPYLFSVDSPDIVEVDNPYERIVSQSFKKQTSPSSNSSLANLLDTVGQGLYSSKRRMFFELLQNADDCASESGTQVKFELSDTHFILAHNGMPFSKQDFDSIISAAKSTKSASKKKTGYKGIGFKSVFTNSTEVTIFSGGFKFAFNKSFSLYNDFKRFYFFINGYENEPLKQQQFLEQFELECRDFHGVKDIPWQLLPIWQESKPHELEHTIFSPTSNVSIALRMDKKMLEEYHFALMEILQHPKFMLFMRSTSRIQYKDGQHHYSSVKKIVDSNANVTLLNNVIENNPKETFHIENSGLILVNNEVFASAGILIKRATRTNSAGIEETILVHIDEQGEIQSEINDIPDRLASADSIEISFAIRTDENGLIHPLDISSKSLDSCFYSYLPMNEHRFKLPLYVNADFDLHSDREGVKADSPWNEFLFYHMGRQLVHAVCNVASASQKNYLNLLLANPFDETNQETEKLSRAFNRGYCEHIHDIPFVINDIRNKVTTQELIIDKSGVTDEISPDLFYALYNNGKRQPLVSIDASILSNEIFNIEQVDVDAVMKVMAEKIAIVQDWINSASSDEQNALLIWLDRNDTDEDFVKQLSIVPTKEGLVSVGHLQSSNNYVFLKSNDLFIESTLNTIGLKTLIIDEDNVLAKYLKQSDQEVFKIISQKLSAIADNTLCIMSGGQVLDFPISLNDKLLLVKYLNSLSNIGEKSIGSLPLFNNVKSVPTPLASMVSYRELAPSFLADYMISGEENVAEIQKYLIPSHDEFDRVIWENRNVLGLTPSELLSYNTTDSEAYLINLVDEAQSNTDLSNLINNVYEASEKVKTKFIDRINAFSLNDDIVYEENSFESKVINLAIATLNDPSEFANKIIYKNKSFSEYSIDEDIICRYTEGDTEKSIKIPLVKLLPAYVNNTIGIHDLRRLFKVSKGFDKLLKTHPKPLNEVFVEVNKLLTLPDREFPIWPNARGNGIQYLFVSFYRRNNRGWNNRYVPDINLGAQSNEFIFEILDFLYKNNITVSSSPFTYHLYKFFKGFYFIDTMISKEESILPVIEAWANSDEKRHKYLSENGVKDGSAKEIRFRRMLIENQRISFLDDLSSSVIKQGLSFVCSYRNLNFPLTGENQIEVINSLYNRSGVDLKRTINSDKLESLSQEWKTPEYEIWKQKKYLHIYLYDGSMPYYIDYNGVHIGQMDSDENFYYNSYTKKLYINRNEELTPLLFTIARSSNPFDMDDYRILCMEGKVSISKDEIEAKNEEIESLKSRVEELERLLSGRSVHIGGTSTGLSKKDQYAALIEAQQALKSKRPDWSFPIGFGERNDDGTPSCFTVETVQNEEGNNMEIVIKSYKKTDERFHINPEEWEAVVKRRAKLLVYTYFKGELDIVEIPKDELVRKQSSIQISFDTSNLDEEKYPDKISEFASILRYFQQITFDFNQFHISKDAVKVKDISSKLDLTITSAEDEDI